MPSVSPALRATGLSVLAAGSVLALSGCGIITSVLGGGNVMELNVGDCFVEADVQAALSSGEVTEVPLVDCAEEHDAEFFHAYDMAQDEYPGEDAALAEMEETCTGQAFTDFIGVSYDDSVIFTKGLYPTEESWNLADDREIICYVVSDSGMVTGTLQGANR